MTTIIFVANHHQAIRRCSRLHLSKKHMERIVLVLNAHNPDRASLEFATRMAAISGTRLTGLFLENTDSEPVLVAQPDAFQYATYLWQTGEVASIRADVDKAVGLLREECLFAGVGLDVIVDKGEPIQQTIGESRFADYIIVDPGLSFSQMEEDVPSHFVQELLSRAECPVLLAPKEFVDVDEVVFCYDGSVSSVFAIKQFTALLPVFRSHRALLLEVNRSGRAEFSDEHKRMMGWLKMHYSSVYYQALNGNAKEELFTYLFLKTGKLVVMGAYGRSLLSNFFRRSHADAIIRMVDLPLFVTHH